MTRHEPISCAVVIIAMFVFVAVGVAVVLLSGA